MKSSAFIFLAAFIALSASWGGFVLAPQLQLGREAQVKPTGSDQLYPVAPAGVAKQGAEVYRSLGCVYCHSQQVGQEGAVCEVVLTSAGTNATATLAALAKQDKELAKLDTLARLPKTIITLPDVQSAVPLLKALSKAGAKAEANVVGQGPDISRGWGLRRSVAQDFAYDQPVQFGARRSGPDLANIALRSPDVNWHLRHLYAPTGEVKGSTMPPYRFLFEKRKITRGPSASALQLSGEFAPPAGYEIIPTDEAQALAAYLVSRRADASLLEAPVTLPTPAQPATNSPAK